MCEWKMNVMLRVRYDAMVYVGTDFHTKMYTDYVRSPAETRKPGLNGQQDHHYQVSDIADKLKVDLGMEDEEAAGMKLTERDEQEEHDQKKPRRKDTPVLNSPPVIPGVKLLKEESRVIHLEDEEKEGKN
ncbi:hypothetical protein MATL_G00254270 [Megalops atlanticus]|uniref:Uncharacterized protein n=1 Tax=Megalops atlanticus TaxID=7932 RepID=A0A9D3STX3_MEGAT|nr:hypothetical protein MATL_G00254270 [Megalops atlanticus]